MVGLAAACGGNGSGAGAGGSHGTGGTTETGGAASGGVSAGGTSGSGGATASSGGSDAGGSAAGGTPGTGGAGGAAGEPPSCQGGGPGISDCGEASETCCSSPKVSGGTFFRKYTHDGSRAENTADAATISDFRLDKYLVTVGRFRRFVAAWDQGDGYVPAVGSGKHTHLNDGKGLADSGAEGAYEAGWLEEYGKKLNMLNDTLDCQANVSTWTSTPGEREQLPMNCVNWFEAYAFCIWDGGFLPSEAEYLYAAAGGGEQRRYPWGADVPGKNNQYAIYGCYYPDGVGDGNCIDTAHIAPVGAAQLGAGKWGQLDLVGNLQKWLLDYFSESYANPCTDCANLAKGSGRAPRDGNFADKDETLLLSAYHNNGFYPDNRFYSFGFRCARSP
jgi:formylglycine-generating enzyme